MMMDETATMASFLLLKASSRPASTGHRIPPLDDSTMEVQGEGEVVIGARRDGDGDDDAHGEGESGARRNRRRREEEDAAQADEANHMQEVSDVTVSIPHIPSWSLFRVCHHSFWSISQIMSLATILPHAYSPPHVLLCEG